jgi:hypothetical protein
VTADSTPGARAKGTMFLHNRDFILAHYGDAAWRDVLESLSPEDVAVIESMAATNWYDQALQIRLFRAI